MRNGREVKPNPNAECLVQTWRQLEGENFRVPSCYMLVLKWIDSTWFRCMNPTRLALPQSISMSTDCTTENFNYIPTPSCKNNCLRTIGLWLWPKTRSTVPQNANASHMCHKVVELRAKVTMGVDDADFLRIFRVRKPSFLLKFNFDAELWAKRTSGGWKIRILGRKAFISARI